MKIIEDFIEYVTEFYNNENGIYPITDKETIKRCCHAFIENRLEAQKPLYFDSFDREEVRCLIQPSHQIFL